MRSLEEIKHANELAMGGDRAQQIKIEDAIVAAVNDGYTAGFDDGVDSMNGKRIKLERAEAIRDATRVSLARARNSLGFAPPSGS